MSQTFTSRPSLISRRRGADRGGLKGASTSSRSSHPDICARSTETSGAPNRSKSTSNSKMSYGSRVTQPGSYSSQNTRTGATGRGRMDYTQNPNLGPSGGADDEAQQNDVERKEQNAGGFTVIPRNEKKWQKIKQVAQKETADYEKFKEANKGQSYHYVGTVGGGQLSEEQVRARQAQQVRAAKYNRQMKQAEQRQAARKAEEDAIEAKRAEARRKAELNAQREAGAAPAVQVRR